MTVTSAWVGRVTADGAEVRAKVSDGPSVRLLVDTESGFGNATPYIPSPREGGVVSFDVAGLTSGTQYFYVIEENENPTLTGSFRTHPAIGAVASFTFAAVGDAGLTPEYPGEGAVLNSARMSNSIVFDTIREHSTDPLFVAHLGDMHYYDLGNAAIVGDGTVDNYRRAYDDTLLQDRQHALYRNVPLVYAWDDHDYGPNNSDGTLATKANAAQVYRERVPHYELPDSGAIYQSWTVGRVLFVLLDVRYYRSPSGDPDNSDKTMLGTVQKDWLASVLGSSTAEALVVLSPVHWIITTSDNDSWGSYGTERNEVAALFADLGWTDRMIMLCADRHALMFDSGANNAWGGFPTYGVAGMDASPHSDASWPHDIGVRSEREQYAIVRVTDTSDAITITTRGYQADTSVVSHEIVVSVGGGGTDPGTVTPNVPVTAGTARQSVTWLSCDLVTGNIIAELPDVEGSVKRVIGEYTSTGLELPIPFGGPAALPENVWDQATAPGRTMIVPVVNDVPAAGFIVLERKGTSRSAKLELGCVSLEGYLRRRYVHNHTWTQQDEASTIAVGLVADAQAQGIRLVIDAPPTGRLRDRTYLDMDDATVYDRLSELMNVVDGPEWTIDVDWEDDQRRSVIKIFRMRKRLGVESTQPDAVFSTEGAADASYEFSEDYADGNGANHILATGDGEGEDRPTSATIDDVLPGWPRYERRFSPGNSIKRSTVLTNHARRELAQLRDGTNAWSVAVRWDAWPRLNIDWSLGDDVGLELTSHRHPYGVTLVRRVIGWELDMQAGTVTPILTEG